MYRIRYRSYIAIVAVIVLAIMLSVGIVADRAVNVYTHNLNMQKRTCIIIDPGHGGVDGGAVSCTGVYESHINLEIALKVNDLMHLLGLKTKMIRSEDNSVYTSGNTIAAKKISDLKQRVKIINETENAILVSIHQNYFSDERYSGPQVFYRNTPQFARVLQTAMIHMLNPSKKRQVKKAEGVYLLQHTTCPAALVECGFLSNREEEAKLRDSNYQKKLAAIISATISSYIYNSSIT